MVEKGSTCRGQLDAANTAIHQLDANLRFQVPDLAAKERLGREEPLLSRKRQTSRFGDEIAKMA